MADAMRDLFKNNIIRASAGTGKTFRLSNRYIRLLASGAKCETILAATFTRKGAGEILDRIVQRLAAAALDAGTAEELSHFVEWSIDQDRAAQILQNLLQHLHLLEIGTLDSFFNRVAKAFSLELGLPPSWEIAEQQQLERLHDESIEEVLHADNISHLLHMMEKGEAQRRIATLIRDTVRRVYSVFRESSPDAWDQLPEPAGRLPVDELEAIRQKMLDFEERITQKLFRKHWREKLLDVIEQENWMGVIESTLFQNYLDGNERFSRSKFYPGMTDLLAQIKQHVRALLLEQLVWRNRSTAELLEMFAAHLEKRKDETGFLGFDDVTSRLMQFMELWSTDQFAFRLDHQIQHLLLDEFQDTSLMQWDVIRPFAMKSTQDDPTRSFFCVGDLKQAIYRWRGGVAEIFDLIESELPNISQGGSLTTSYRSSPTVIGLVNDVFGSLEQYEAKDDAVVNGAIADWSKWFEPHKTVKEFAGYASIEMAEDCEERDKRWSPNEGTKIKARNRKVTDTAFERIRKLHANLPPHLTIGVLFRTNAGVANMIFRLQREGIPASEEGGTPITDSAAVELILSAMQLADHPNDDLARYHVSHSALGEMFGLQPESHQTQSANRGAATVGAASLRRRLVDEGYGPVVESMASLLRPKATRRETRRLEQIVHIAFTTDKDPGRWYHRPSKFAQYVREEVKVSDETSARIRVMTIHQSKGLEFDAVVLPMEMSANDFAPFPPDVVVGRDQPTSPIHTVTRYVGIKRRKLLPKEIQKIFDDDRRATVRESLCLLYVALTRAVYAVHIIVSYGAKPGAKSAEAVLLSTLLGTKFERATGVLYEHPTGSRLWYKMLTKASIAPAPTGDNNKYYLPANAKPQKSVLAVKPTSGRGRAVRDANHFGSPGKMKLGDLFDRRDNSDALHRGHVFHSCFELVRWLDFGKPQRDKVVRHLKTVAPWLRDPSHVVDRFMNMLEQPRIAALLTQQNYLNDYLSDFVTPSEVVVDAYRLEVATERPFATTLGDGIIHGRIDRLVFVYEAEQLIAADIIDYKTDSESNQNEPLLLERYRHQMKNYRRAVASWTGLPTDQVSTRLVYLETGCVNNLLHGRHECPAPSIPQPKSRGKKTRSGQPKLSNQKKLWDDV